MKRPRESSGAQQTKPPPKRPRKTKAAIAAAAKNSSSQTNGKSNGTAAEGEAIELDLPKTSGTRSTSTQLSRPTKVNRKSTAAAAAAAAAVVAANKGVSNSKTANNTDNNSAIARGDIIELNSSTINSVTATNSTTDGDDIDDDDNDERVPYTTTVARTQGPKRQRQTKGLATGVAPLHNIEEIFEVSVKKACGQGLEDALKYFEGRSIRVATMCSGTESPLLALNLIVKDHVFSAEIVPFKQAYIERNFHPKILFRDVREIARGSEATTAFGNLVPIPDDVDIMIAGTSCVDFSRLNSHTKKITDNGESGDTFRSLVEYLARFRPAICIMENVKSAPWKEIQGILSNDFEGLSANSQEHYSGIWKDGDRAYAAKVVQLDTKDYYIPQTRQRGYLVAIDRKYEDADNAVDEWVRKLEDLEQRASSPVESFLSEDTVATDMSNSPAFIKKHGREVDWDICYARHQEYRISSGLGTRRPLTQWVRGGSCTGPDHWQLDWVRAQVERVWDTLDVCHLRNAQRGFDDSYKMRMLELSQNVDRFTDTQQHGFIGCLTPCGYQFSTIRGGPLTGREALRLQGLPVHNMLLTRETQRELLDLAGNAMTTTVVGAALLAALIVGHKAISIGCGRPNSIENSASTRVEEMKGDALMPYQVSDLTKYEKCNLDELRDRARASRRLCFCEGRTRTLKRSFKNCRLCEHTACDKCAGTPRHDYYVLPKFERLIPSAFIEWLTNLLPMRVQLKGLKLSHMGQKLKTHRVQRATEEEADWQLYAEAIRPALEEELRFESVTRFKQWVVRYDAPRSYLELTIGETPCWRLYAKPDRQLPNDNRTRSLLKHPFARMHLKKGDDFLAGEWEFWLPIPLECFLNIEGFGSMTESWESQLGIQIKQPAVEKVHSKVKIGFEGEVCSEIRYGMTDIVGEYELLEDCGNACRSLHRKIQPSGSSPLYFFLDPQRIGPPKQDSFVFSNHHHRLTLGETREVIAKINPAWRQGRTEMKKVECTFDGLWVACSATLQVFQGPSDVTCAVARGDFPVSISRGIALDPDLSTGVQTCSAETLMLISCKVPLEKPEVIGWQLGPCRQADQESEAVALGPFAWLFQRSRDLGRFSSEWRRVSLPSDLRRCLSCSPAPPSIKWRPSNQRSSLVVPYEDERQAGAFERALKSRAKPFLIQKRLEKDGQGYIGRLQVGLNIAALAHRVLSKASSRCDHGIQLSWRLDTAYEWPLEIECDEFVLKDNKDGNEEEHVFYEPSSNNHPKELGRLRREQRRSLWWMRQQESGCAPQFFEQEIEEAYLPTLGWLAETVAKYPSKASGGVLADEVGYGKTATTLALIDTTVEQADQHISAKSGPGYTSRATLIIVPSTLISQWRSQIVKFLGKDYKVLTIDSIHQLNSFRVTDIVDAHVVLLSWRVLNSNVYHRNLCAFAAMPECSVWTGRPYKTWLKQSVKRMDDHAEELESSDDTEGFWRTLDERMIAASQNDDAAIPSKRLRGASYANQKRRDAKKSPKDDEPVEKIPSSKIFKIVEPGGLMGLKGPPIQLFHFHRIVVDEYTYLDDADFQAICSLRATHRWVLSGTPKLVDFADVKFLAALLKVNLGVDDDAPTALQRSNIEKIRGSRTAAEKFRSFVEVHSPAWHAHRSQHAQNFLNHFVRKNTAEIDRIQVVEILRPVVLCSWERAIFMELHQMLCTEETRLSRRSGNKNDGDRVKRMKDVLNVTKSPAEALLKGCSHLDGKTFAWTPDRKEENPSGTIIEQRQVEHNTICTELARNLKHAEWLQRQLEKSSCNGKQLRSTERWIRNSNGDSDPEGTAEVKRLLNEAEKGYEFDHQDEFYRDDPGNDVRARDQAELKKRKDEAKKAATAAAREMKHTKSSVARRTNRKSKTLVHGAGVQSGPSGTGDGGPEERLSYEEKMDEILEPIDCRPLKINLADHDAIRHSLKAIMNDVSKLGLELLSRRRALRFMSTTREFQLWQCALGPAPTCLGCDKAADDPSKTFVLGLCGHVACMECLEKRCPGTGCVTRGCSSAADPQHIHVATDFASIQQTGSLHGTKLQSIISLILDVADNDQVLLFVQFQSLLEVICGALKTSGISYYAIPDGAVAGAGRMAHDFQENQSESKKKVLVLNPSNESAAGLNLVNANHVIFVSPLLAKSKHEHDQARTQCIGRARRYGQLKTVYVYDFLALRTIDVDITEKQRGKRLVRAQTPNGEEIWKLKNEKEMSDTEKEENWGSGWEMSSTFEEL